MCSDRGWVQHSCISCASMLWSWSGVEVEGVRGGQRWPEKGKGGHTMTIMEALTSGSKKGWKVCVTRHMRHASVTHFRPKWGNVVEVALVTSSTMYIISHTKGTYFPLARITNMTPL